MLDKDHFPLHVIMHFLLFMNHLIDMWIITLEVCIYWTDIDGEHNNRLAGTIKEGERDQF